MLTQEQVIVVYNVLVSEAYKIDMFAFWLQSTFSS